jgi:PKD repeat protein
MKKNILALTIILTLVMTPLAGLRLAQADFLSCVAEGGNVGTCLEESQSGTTTSFTEFKGELQAPSEEGYAEKLTEATDVRTYALNVTNFALGFLSMIAVLIIIYGGFLYVTAAGKEDQAGKGKKAITYAIIGILVILGSFAIVNTVLQAPGGKEGTLQGAAEGQSVVGSSVQARFNTQAERVSRMARDLATAYSYHFDAIKDMDAVRQAIINVGSTAENEQMVGQYINDAILKLNNMKGKVSDETTDAIMIRSAIDDLISYLTKYMNDVNAKISMTMFEELSCGFGIGEDSAECLAAVKAAIKEVPYDISAYEAARTAVTDNINSTIISIKMALRDIYSVVGPLTSIADEAFKKFVTDLTVLSTDKMTPSRDDIYGWGGPLKTFGDQVKSSTGITDGVQKQLFDLVTAFGDLYSILKDIMFVRAKITATVTEGNSPLVVNFSSVGSEDPSGLTITDQQIQWDLNGDNKWDGVSGEQYMNCNEVSKATTTCTYLQPGTYRVTLKIKPSDADHAATGNKWSEEIGVGLATITIKVNPPQTKIKLSVDDTVEGDSYYLINYDENGFLTVNRSSIYVLASTAKTTGIQFNGSLTEAKEGLLSAQAADGATIRWDFGDGSRDPNNNAIQSATPPNLSPRHVFENEGTYTVTAEFTDKNGVVDRKIFTVIVSSIAPLMKINPETVRLGDEVTFDGSRSASDKGQLKYKWTITPQPEGLTPDSLTSDKFKYRFTKPSPSSVPYKVSLEVDDSIDKASTEPETLVITSKPPVSQFVWEIPKETQPGTVLLDGTKSYDPDGTETLKYQWEINGQKLASTDDYQFVAPTTPTSDKAIVKFKNTGVYVVTLLATDPAEPNPAGEVAAEKEIQIDNILDIAWGEKDTNSAVLKEGASGEMEAPVSLTLLSETAVAYEVDYGDGEKENGDMSKTVAIKHNYKEAGTFVVKATVYDEEDNGNSLSRKVYVGSSKQPVAVIGIALNGENIIPEPGEKFEIGRTDIVTFDASGSRNTDGTGRRLNYSWDLGDGERSTKEKVTHTYKDTGTYKVSLKAVNSEDVSQGGTDTFEITVKGLPPTLQSLTAVPTGSSLTTPVTVQLNAIGASDADGKIVKYRWWYYDPANDEDELGSQVSTSPSASVIIGTRGDEGQERTYKFAVEITDNENNTIGSREILDEKTSPELAVTNGPNKSPVAKFNVDRTDIMVGDAVNFTSASTDPDGQIKAYYWDWEGNGFADNTKSEGSTVSHVFTAPAPNGIRVKLKVVDNNESESTSDPVVIYVEGVAQPPTAAFTSAQDGTTKKVKFTNTSKADTASGANITSYAWDFDTATDANGDGKKDNDAESSDKDPAHDYKEYGIYRAKLVVTDSDGNKGEITNYVNVKAPVAVPVTPVTQQTQETQQTQQVSLLDARLLTTPAPSFVDNKIHLTGDSKDVTLDFSTSVGKIKKYAIDKNVYFDTNGNGIKDDDEDYTSTVAGKWTTNFSRSFGNIRVRLTVTDDTGKKDSVDKDIVFDQPSGSVFTADVFGAADMGIAAFLVAAAGFAIMSIKRLIAPINKQK